MKNNINVNMLLCLDLCDIVTKDKITKYKYKNMGQDAQISLEAVESSG